MQRVLHRLTALYGGVHIESVKSHPYYDGEDYERIDESDDF